MGTTSGGERGRERERKEREEEREEREREMGVEGGEKKRRRDAMIHIVHIAGFIINFPTENHKFSLSQNFHAWLSSSESIVRSPFHTTTISVGYCASHTASLNLSAAPISLLNMNIAL